MTNVIPNSCITGQESELSNKIYKSEIINNNTCQKLLYTMINIFKFLMIRYTSSLGVCLGAKKM